MEAAKVISGAPRIVVLIGNRIDPIPLVDFQTYWRELAKRTDRQLRDVYEEARRAYWNCMESVRMQSGNFFPNTNYFLILWLVHKKQTRVIISTNYDLYLQSTLHRTGTPSILNPVLCSENEWDRQGYYNLPSKEACQIWKVHGDLGFMRFFACGHVLKMPCFILGPPLDAPPSELAKDGFCSPHGFIVKPDGERFGDSSLTLACEWAGMSHHVDFGKDRNIFSKEMEAAFQAAEAEFKQGAALIILGLTASKRYPEGEIVSWLSEHVDHTPIIYVNSSRGPMSLKDSQILEVLNSKKSTPEAYFINEIYPQGVAKFGILHALSNLLEDAGADLAECEARIEEWWHSGLWHVSL